MTGHHQQFFVDEYDDEPQLNSSRPSLTAAAATHRYHQQLQRGHPSAVVTYYNNQPPKEGSPSTEIQPAIAANHTSVAAHHYLHQPRRLGVGQLRSKGPEHEDVEKLSQWGIEASLAAIQEELFQSALPRQLPVPSGPKSPSPYLDADDTPVRQPPPLSHRNIHQPQANAVARSPPKPAPVAATAGIDSPRSTTHRPSPRHPYFFEEAEADPLPSEILPAADQPAQSSHRHPYNATDTLMEDSTATSRQLDFFKGPSEAGDSMQSARSGSLVAEVRQSFYLSPQFHCSESDAARILEVLQSVQQRSRDDEKILLLEGEVKSLGQRLQRKGDECERLRDDLSEARQKQAAVEAQAKVQMKGLSQRREEARKQLIVEETRTARLEFQNKTLNTEVEKLKAKVHSLLSKQ